MVEEALRSEVPVLMIDVKGDLPNLMLCFSDFLGSSLAPWLDVHPSDPRAPHEVAEALAKERREQLARWSIAEPELKSYAGRTAFRVITPGSSAGELLHVLSSLERRNERWDHDPESARAALSAAVSPRSRRLTRTHILSTKGRCFVIRDGRISKRAEKHHEY